LVDPLIEWRKEVEIWGNQLKNQDKFWYLIDHCQDDLEESGKPQACRTESESWLEHSGVSKGELENRLEGSAGDLMVRHLAAPVAACVFIIFALLV